jgi:putative transcription antitermination factor YqgF
MLSDNAVKGDPAFNLKYAVKACKGGVARAHIVPYRLDGSVGPQAEKVIAFVERLRRCLAVPGETWDERLTSVEADERLAAAGVRRQQRKGRIDRAAAALVLQEFLDARRARPVGA